MHTHLPDFRKIIFEFLPLITLNTLAQPTISSFAPASGPVGTSVTITGANFNAVPASNLAYFSAVPAIKFINTSLIKAYFLNLYNRPSMLNCLSVLWMSRPKNW